MKELKEANDDLQEITELLRKDPPAVNTLLKILKSGKPHAEIQRDLEKAEADMKELVRNINSLKKIMNRENRNAGEKAEHHLKKIKELSDKYNLLQ
jgi:Mg2+ and Co2+ transporter CorA